MSRDLGDGRRESQRLGRSVGRATVNLGCRENSFIGEEAPTERPKLNFATTVGRKCISFPHKEKEEKTGAVQRIYVAAL